MALQPAIMFIFGSTGDLSHRKLYPALYALHAANRLADNTVVLGIGRRDWDDERYRESIAAAVRSAEPAAEKTMADFTRRFFYHRLDISDKTAYNSLWHKAGQLEKLHHLQGNRLYFLATAPDHFPLIARQIGLGQPAIPGCFRRLMIEKPFGADLSTARTFNKQLRQVFAEDEIFRIDHYLGKEMLQNILVLRFANQLFEPAWNCHHIDHIQVSVTEPFGIGQRAGYYDKSGALRDMVQSHLLQLVALLTMDQPSGEQADDIRDAKVRLLRAIRLFSREAAETDVVMGQYDGDERRRPYLKEDGIPPDSRTETYAALRLWIDQGRWQGVPVYVRTGKRLQRHLAKITIVFKEPSYDIQDQDDRRNILVIRIQPEEGIDLRFNIKQPGMTNAVTQARMNICQNCDPLTQSPQAYEKLIHDAWQGDLSLFTRWDEIEATWTLIDSIRLWRAKLPLYLYRSGSDGPVAADRMLERDGRAWLDL